jgi:hypothetical protein
MRRLFIFENSPTDKTNISYLESKSFGGDQLYGDNKAF